MCEHLHFVSKANIGRITDGEGGPVIYHMLDLHVECEDCKTPFHFVGYPTGYSPNAPSISWDGLELRTPISPGPIPVDERAHQIRYDASKPTRDLKQ